MSLGMHRARSLRTRLTEYSVGYEVVSYLLSILLLQIRLIRAFSKDSPFFLLLHAIPCFRID